MRFIAKTKTFKSDNCDVAKTLEEETPGKISSYIHIYTYIYIYICIYEQM